MKQLELNNHIFRTQETLLKKVSDGESELQLIQYRTVFDWSVFEVRELFHGSTIVHGFRLIEKQASVLFRRVEKKLFCEVS